MANHRIHKLVVGGTSALVLAAAATALAAHPKSGARFSGTTSAKVNGYGGPVGFTVSSDGKKLTAFSYATFGCFGAGGFSKGNPYKQAPGATQRLGTLPVSSKGAFSVTGVKTTYTNKQGYKTVTTSSVAGSFETAKRASGTITISQKLSRNGKAVNGNGCGPVSISFTASAK
jgi:hypothetical protein